MSIGICYEGGLDENGKPARANLAGFFVFLYQNFFCVLEIPLGA